jgi:hypothetical protein
LHRVQTLDGWTNLHPLTPTTMPPRTLVMNVLNVCAIFFVLLPINVYFCLLSILVTSIIHSFGLGNKFAVMYFDVLSTKQQLIKKIELKNNCDYF